MYHTRAAPITAADNIQKLFLNSVCSRYWRGYGTYKFTFLKKCPYTVKSQTISSIDERYDFFAISDSLYLILNDQQQNQPPWKVTLRKFKDIQFCRYPKLCCVAYGTGFSHFSLTGQVFEVQNKTYAQNSLKQD